MAQAEVEITEDGYVRMDAWVAANYFPDGALAAVRDGSELWLVPLVGPQGGGLLLKQRNARGDRCALVRDFLPPDAYPGRREAVWDPERAALRVHVSMAP